jgi:hypothetical protein
MDVETNKRIIRPMNIHKLNETEYYRLLEVSKGASNEKFPQYPLSYREIILSRYVHLFICNSDGSLFKDGLYRLTDLYTYENGEENIKPFLELFNIKLHHSIYELENNI